MEGPATQGSSVSLRDYLESTGRRCVSLSLAVDDPWLQVSERLDGASNSRMAAGTRLAASVDHLRGGVMQSAATSMPPVHPCRLCSREGAVWAECDCARHGFLTPSPGRWERQRFLAICQRLGAVRWEC